jgi:hypothetical protein
LCLGGDRFLRIGIEFACCSRFCAHALHRIHYIRLLRKECIA